MSFCSNCGSEILDNQLFCPECGTPVESIIPKVEKKKPRISKKIIAILSGILAVILLIVGAVMIFGRNNPEDVAIDYYMALKKYDYKRQFKYLAMDTEKYLEDKIDYRCELRGQSRDDFYKWHEENSEDNVSIEDMNDLYKKLLFKEYEAEIEIDDLEKLSKRKLREAIEKFENQCYSEFDIDDYIDTKKITEGYTVTLEVEEDDDSKFPKVTVVKYKGKWKVLDYISESRFLNIIRLGQPQLYW